MLHRVCSWLFEEAREKLDIRATFRELKSLGQKHGRRFFIVAVLWEMIEDILFPYLAYMNGFPELIPVFLVLHVEPIVYPIFFWLFRMWDRIHGREPWEPDRLAASSYWRTAMQTLGYRAVALLMFWLILAHLQMSIRIFTFYTLIMTFFWFIHDRLWHDSNYGIIIATDTVQPKRVFAKAITYRIVSILCMTGLFFGLYHNVPNDVWVYQGVMFILSLAMGALWAHSPLGVYRLSQNQRGRK